MSDKQFPLYALLLDPEHMASFMNMMQYMRANKPHYEKMGFLYNYVPKLMYPGYHDKRLTPIVSLRRTEEQSFKSNVEGRSYEVAYSGPTFNHIWQDVVVGLMRLLRDPEAHEAAVGACSGLQALLALPSLGWSAYVRPLNDHHWPGYNSDFYKASLDKFFVDKGELHSYVDCHFGYGHYAERLQLTQPASRPTTIGEEVLCLNAFMREHGRLSRKLHNSPDDYFRASAQSHKSSHGPRSWKEVPLRAEGNPEKPSSGKHARAY